MNPFGYIFFLFFLLLNFSARAQVVLVDKIGNNQQVVTPKDSANGQIAIKDSIYKPDPVKTLRMAAILPGSGQIINRKYWKLPIVYGGFAAFGYAIYWNSTQYKKYTRAYIDIADTDPATTSYLDILPVGRTIDNYGGIGNYTTTLKTAQENYRRNRDLSIIGTIGFYALTVVDAYVDAQLYDFDISPDLSLRIQPILMGSQFGTDRVFAMQCQFNIK